MPRSVRKTKNVKSVRKTKNVKSVRKTKRVSRKSKRVSRKVSRKRVSRKVSRKKVSRKVSRKRVSRKVSRKRVSRKVSRKSKNVKSFRKLHYKLGIKNQLDELTEQIVNLVDQMESDGIETKYFNIELERGLPPPPPPMKCLSDFNRGLSVRIQLDFANVLKYKNKLILNRIDSVRNLVLWINRDGNFYEIKIDSTGNFESIAKINEYRYEEVPWEDINLKEVIDISTNDQQLLSKIQS